MLTAPGSTSYAYDGLGNRIQQTVSSIVTDYLLDVQPGLVKVLAQTENGDTTRYLHSPRGIHAQQDDLGAWSWMLQDGLGSVRSFIDASLGVDAVQSYDPYGNPEGSYGAGFGFTGEQTDGNGQVYLRARYYNPGIGVFNSLDRFEGLMQRPMSLNGYSWVEGNVPNRIDPAGRTALAPLNLTSLDNVGMAMTLNGGLCGISSSGGISSPIRTGVGSGTPNLGSGFDGVCCLNLIVGTICFTDCPNVPWPLPNPFFEPPDPQDALQETIDLIDQLGHFVIDSVLNLIDPFGWIPRSEEIVQFINEFLYGGSSGTIEIGLQEIIQQAISPACVGTLGSGNCSDVARRVLERVGESDLGNSTTVIVWGDGGALPPGNNTNILFDGVTIGWSNPPFATSFHIYLEFIRNGLSIVWDNAGVFVSSEVYQSLLTPNPPAWRHCKAAQSGLTPATIGRLVDAVQELGLQARSPNRRPSPAGTPCDPIS